MSAPAAMLRSEKSAYSLGDLANLHPWIRDSPVRCLRLFFLSANYQPSFVGNQAIFVMMLNLSGDNVFFFVHR